MEIEVKHFAPVATYLDLLVMKAGKFIGSAGPFRTSMGKVITVETERLDYFCEYQLISKLVGKLIHKAYFIDITDVPNGESVVKDPTVPAWLNEFAA